MGGVSIWHWIIVGIVVMLLFGRGKISEMMGDVAKGIKAFKKGMSDEEAVAAATPPTSPIIGTVPEPVRPIEHRETHAAPAAPVAADRKVG